MKNALLRLAALACIGLALVAAAGCASVAVTGDALQRNTATALNVPAGSFTIANRVDSGVKTTYDVTTAGGQTYSCYVTGALSVVGRSVSDAVCHPVGKTTAAAGAPAAAPATCNALLKAAGKC